MIAQDGGADASGLPPPPPAWWLPTSDSFGLRRFSKIDTNRSGTLDVIELQRALSLGGLNFSLKTVQVMDGCYRGPLVLPTVGRLPLDTSRTAGPSSAAWSSAAALCSCCFLCVD